MPLLAGLEGAKQNNKKRKAMTCEHHGDGDFACNIRNEKTFRNMVY